MTFTVELVRLEAEMRSIGEARRPRTDARRLEAVGEGG